MTREHSLDSAGTMLLEVDQFGERRQVFARVKEGAYEVGELTQGELTWELYDAPAQFHQVSLDVVTARRIVSRLRKALSVDGTEGFESLLVHFFADDQRFLVDLMDGLDACNVTYDYTSGIAGGRTFYRSGKGRPLLRLVR